MELTDADRVRCATFLLSRDARLWWESASVAINLQTLSWTEFKEVFFANYFTEEGDNSVAEFVRRFERGCYFVPLISNDAQAKLRHFMDGSRQILRRDVRVAGPTSYVVAVSRALAAEQDQRDIEADRQGKRPYQAPPQHPQQQHQRPQFKRSFQRAAREETISGTAKGQGSNSAARGTSACKYFKCGASDHMLKECPQWKQPIQGRFFAMHAQEANPDTTLLTGNIFIKRLVTTALIDSGVTHSFISETFANHLDIKSIGLDMNFSVTVPSGEELLVTSVIRDIDLELQGHLVYADLILLPLPEFDIILGKDWLTKNRVLIDFQKRSVLVRPLGIEQFLFEPDRWRSFPRMISCMQARRLISMGCQAFLASIISAPNVPSPSLPDVPVAPYRLALAEMLELKQQIQELLDKECLLIKDFTHSHKVIILVQIYVDDVIFGSTNSKLCEKWQVNAKAI
ncbi:uncharacterized protein [Primulina eburnea]|uniref:uncharacterized protein n=1 Tax=Primulina eburnea TaxID=1245227 RepID=UPI003C6C0E2A